MNAASQLPQKKGRPVMWEEQGGASVSADAPFRFTVGTAIDGPVLAASKHHGGIPSWSNNPATALAERDCLTGNTGCFSRAYVSAFRALGTFREEAALATWLSRIVINEAQGRLRGRREMLPLTDLDDTAMGEIIQFPSGANADPERQAAIGEIRILLEDAIDALPVPFREVFLLRQVEGLSTEETAHVLSIEPQTVKTRLHRARTRLRQALQDQLAPALKDMFPFEGERCQRLTRIVIHRLGLNSQL